MQREVRVGAGLGVGGRGGDAGRLEGLGAGGREEGEGSDDRRAAGQSAEHGAQGARSRCGVRAATRGRDRAACCLGVDMLRIGSHRWRARPSRSSRPGQWGVGSWRSAAYPVRARPRGCGCEAGPRRRRCRPPRRCAGSADAGSSRGAGAPRGAWPATWARSSATERHGPHAGCTGADARGLDSAPAALERMPAQPRPQRRRSALRSRSRSSALRAANRRRHAVAARQHATTAAHEELATDAGSAHEDRRRGAPSSSALRGADAPARRAASPRASSTRPTGARSTSTSRHRLVVETDGWRDHGLRAPFERDRAKDAALVAAGYTVHALHQAPMIADDPDTVAERVRAGCCRAFASAPARAW